MKVEISDNFTIDDIHKIREADYEYTKDMTMSELLEYFDKCGKEASGKIDESRKKQTAA